MTEKEESLKKSIEDVKKISIVADLLDVVCQTTGMGFAAVARVTEDRWITCASRDDLGFGLKPGDELQVKTTICDEIRQDCKAVIIDHVQKDLRFREHHTPAMYGFQSYISVPIICKNGSFFGTLCAIDPKPRDLSTPKVTNMFYLFADLISFHLNALDEISDSREQLQDERQLHNASKRHQLALEAGKLGSYELDIATGKIDCTLQCKINFGQDSTDELSYPELMEMILPEDLPHVKKSFEKAVADNTNYDATYRIKTKKGDIRWIHVSALPVYDQYGKPVQMTGVTADITNQKNTEIRINDVIKELELHQEKLNIIITASELGTWELHLKTGEFSYSEKYLEFLGYPKGSKITHEEIKKHIHPEDLPIRAKAFEQAVVSGILRQEIRIIWDDGSIHWLEARGKVFFDDDGTPLKMLGTARDLTEEKHYQKQLEEREQKFRLLADSMPQHIWTSDPQGNLNYYNRSVFNYAGMTPRQIEESGWLDIVHPQDREENMKAWEEAVSTGKDFLFEHRFRRYDGEYRWQLSRAIPQKDADGNIRMWVGTSTDIQGQKDFTDKLEKKVRERTQQLAENNAVLEKMNKELQSFAYISSHDLQEPLRKIQTFATLLLEKEYGNLSESGQDAFRRMHKAAERMQILIKDLLAYSRSSVDERNFEITDLNEIVEEVKSDLREELQHLEGKVVINVIETCHAKVIPFQFRQLLYNLVSNSIKFAKPHGALQISIKCKIGKGSAFKNPVLAPNADYSHISLSDNGIGFEQEYAEKIFELFQRLHGKTEYDGTGIGLAIVKKIVENHHGFIMANGKINEGATFDIYIPVDIP